MTLAGADTTLGEMANDTKVQLEKGGQLDFTCSWPTPVEAALPSANRLGVMPNMEDSAIDSQVLLSNRKFGLVIIST